MTTSAFRVKPPTPTAADRLTRMAQAEALLAATMPPTAPADLAYADCELPSDHDLTIGVDDHITVMRPGDLAPRQATVLAVRGDGQFLVHYAFGASKWVNESDIQLRVTAAAWNTEAVG